MLKITKEWLREVKACKEGREWFFAQKETDCKKIILKLIYESKLDWANWTISWALSMENKIRYAIYAAEQVLVNFEKIYPNDKIPREAIQAALNYIKEPAEENIQAAYCAATAAYYAANVENVPNAANYVPNAAYYAANAAYYAANAAYYAANAENAAKAAYYAANAAYYAAYSAACSVAVAKDMKTMIIKYGIKLLEVK